MADEEISLVEFGELRQSVRTLTAVVATLSEKVETLTTQMSEARGGWRIITVIGGAGATLGALIGPYLSKLFKLVL